MTNFDTDVLPTLAALDAFEPADRHDEFDVLADLRERGYDERNAQDIAKLMIDSGLISANTKAADGRGNIDIWGERITAEGLRALGQWPRHGEEAVVVLNRLADALESRGEQAAAATIRDHAPDLAGAIQLPGV